MIKPSAVEVIAQRVPLRRSGNRWLGLCPFHTEKTPSFSVTERGFYCFGCQEHGDVIAFIQRLDNLNFVDACKSLGIERDRLKPRPPITPSRQRAAEVASQWINSQHSKFNVLIAEKLEQIFLADEVYDDELLESIDRELIILRAFYDSLDYPSTAAELLSMQQSIEAITDGTGESL